MLAAETFLLFTDSCAVSVYVAILQRRIAVNVPKEVTEAAVSAGLPSSSVDAVLGAIGSGSAIDDVPGMNPTIAAAVGDAVKTAYSASYGTVYLASIAFGCIAVLASIFTKDIDQYLTNYVSRRINGTVGTEVPMPSKEKQEAALEEA